MFVKVKKIHPGTTVKNGRKAEFITLGPKTMYLSAGLTEAIGRPDRVEIFYDKDKKEIALGFTNEETEDSFRLSSTGSGKGSSISAMSLYKSMGVRLSRKIRVKPYKMNGFVVVKLNNLTKPSLRIQFAD